MYSLCPFHVIFRSFAIVILLMTGNNNKTLFMQQGIALIQFEKHLVIWVSANCANYNV